MRIAIFYATREGQTRRIADHLADAFTAHGFVVDVADVAAIEVAPDLGQYAAVVLAASLHMGGHEREMVEFVQQQREALGRTVTAFLSVSLSETGAEDPRRTTVERAKFAADTRRVIDEFLAETKWRPTHVLPVAGALNYSRYNFFVRFIMKHIAASAGADTDTSHDHEYTDWAALDHFVDELSVELAPPVHAPS